MAEWLEGKIAGKRHWSQALYSLQIDAPLADFTAGQYIKVALDVDGERVGGPTRWSTPRERPLEIYFNEIPEGPLTPRCRTWRSATASGSRTRPAASSPWTTWSRVGTCGCWPPARRSGSTCPC
jgi:ferredoxin--NADP+ reductase